MIKLAIDLKALRQFPKQCWELLWQFPHHCVFVGAPTNDPCDDDELVENARAEIKRFVDWRVPIILFRADGIRAAQLRAEYCRDNRIGVLVDPTPMSAVAARGISPATMALYLPIPYQVSRNVGDKHDHNGTGGQVIHDGASQGVS